MVFQLTKRTLQLQFSHASERFFHLSLNQTFEKI